MQNHEFKRAMVNEEWYEDIDKIQVLHGIYYVVTCLINWLCTISNLQTH